MKILRKSQRAFTLIELLVVISIIAVLSGVALTNFVGTRGRASDTKKKLELAQIKNSLRLYYNDHAQYPGPASNTDADCAVNGCGVAGTSACTEEFCVEDAGGVCTTVYMKQFPSCTEDYAWGYTSVSSGDDFCLWTALDNESDPEIAKSQGRCSLCSVTAESDYVLCAD